MKSQPESAFSALFDGELAPHEARRLLDTASLTGMTRQQWQDYALIGDVLRHEPHPDVDLTAAVMARLQDEPVILAPRRVHSARGQHPFLALAASVAGVAVVGWLALAGRPPAWSGQPLAAASSPPMMVRHEPVNVRPVRHAIEPAAWRGEMRELLIAHQMQASSFRLNDTAEHIRTVAATAP